MDASEFAAEFQEPFSVDPFADYLPPEPNPIPDLLDFLEKFGPLGEVAAIVNLVPRWERPPGLDLPPATVNLHLLFLELQEVARRYSEAIKFRNGKQARPKWASRLRDFGSEYRTVPRYLNDRIILEAIPRTLGARLQTWLLSLVVTRPTDTICRFCEHQFIVPLQRGRPAQYCARHKAPKFRKSWQRGTEVRYREAHPDECLGDTDHVAPGAGSEATVRALARQARR